MLATKNDQWLSSWFNAHEIKLDHLPGNLTWTPPKLNPNPRGFQGILYFKTLDIFGVGMLFLGATFIHLIH